MEYDEDDENDDNTIFAEEGERYINPQVFYELVSLFQKYTMQLIIARYIMHIAIIFL